MENVAILLIWNYFAEYTNCNSYTKYKFTRTKISLHIHIYSSYSLTLLGFCSSLVYILVVYIVTIKLFALVLFSLIHWHPFSCFLHKNERQYSKNIRLYCIYSRYKFSSAITPKPIVTKLHLLQIRMNFWHKTK